MVDRTIVYRLQADVAAAEANIRHFGSTVRKTAGDLTAVGKEGEKFRRGLTDVGDTAGKVGLVAAAGLGATVKAAMDWESAWAGVSKTVDGSATQMGKLEGQLRELARTMPATHQEIAATAEAAGQLGVARDDVAAFTEIMVQLGETTNLTADEAATSIAQFMNVMKSTGDDVDEIGNTLVDLGNKGASTEAQILNMAQRLSGAGSLVGATEADVLALASAMANLGIQSELGGGAIQRVFTGIYQKAAQGADGLTGFAEVAGMTAQDFADQWANDPIRAFDAFLQGLGRIKESGGNVVGTLDDLGIKGTQNLQVMLRLAGAGDMLTSTLDQSSSAWEQNTALTDEYGKRADTTAAQVQVAWNQIKDAAIESGSAILPVVAEAAGVVGDLATAFGGLPGPVKASVTGLAGVTAVLGGGLWFTAKTINGVATMRSALADLNVTADGTKSKLGGLATAGTVAAGVYALSGAVVALANSLDESLPGLETLQGRLIDLASTPAGFSVSLGQEFDSLGASIDRLADPSKWQQLNDMAGSFNDAILPGDARDKGVREATKEIDALDSALASLATSGNGDMAADALDRLIEAYGLTGDQAEWLRSQLPKYDEALAGVENQAKLTGGATDDMAGATDGLAGAVGTATAEVEDFGDVLDRLNEKLSGRADMRSYEAAIDDFTKSIKENGNTFDINTEKGRTNQAQLDNIASTALKVSENMGRAARQKFLTGAIQDLRTMGESMGVPKSEINKLIALLREANNTNVKPKIDVDTAASMAKIQAVRNSIESLRDRNLTITTVHKVVGNAADALPYRGEADGGVLSFYANGGMREQHIAQIAPAGSWRVWAEPETGGEAYIPLAPAKRERSIDIWEEVGARLGVQFERFAAGGATGGKKRKRRSASGGLDSPMDLTPTEEEEARAAEAARLYYEQLATAERERERAEQQRIAIAEATLEGQQRAWDIATDAAQAQVDAAQSMVDAVQNSMQRIGEAATSAFSGSWFSGGRDRGLWTGSGSGDWRARGQAAISGLEERDALITQLSGLGLTGPALEDLLGNQDNAGIAAMIKAGEIGDYAAMFARFQQLQQSVSQHAGIAGYGAEYGAAQAVMAQATSQLAALTAAIQAARPITVLEAVSAQATAQELARLLAMTGSG